MLIPFDQLFKAYEISTPGVLHLGANTGQEAEAYHKQGISEVIWVEALPDIFKKLEQTIAGYPGHRALLACVSDVDGEVVTFNIASNGGQSSSFLEPFTHLQEHPTVLFNQKVKMATIRVDTLLSWHKVDIGQSWFLNADLQGAELKALKGMGNLLWKFDYAYLEVNTRELYRGCPFLPEIDDYLERFRLVGAEIKMTGSGWGDKLYVRR